jgi:hypothetical protein
MTEADVVKIGDVVDLQIDKVANGGFCIADQCALHCHVLFCLVPVSIVYQQRLYSPICHVFVS